ncbi:hypothetical protein WJX84_004812, partial [Apatococcus fuscideae]
AAVEKGIISMSAGLEAARSDQSLKNLLKGEAASLLPSPVEVIAFSDEEGLRFQSTFLGSQAVTGTLVGSGLLEARDSQGDSLMEVLQGEGLAQSPSDVMRSRLKASSVQGYVEVHMEQGPVLEALSKPLGVVTAIAGQSRLSVTMKGTQGHAGTIPMPLRRDPLAGAAEAIHQIETTCNGGPRGAGHPPFEGDGSLVCTVGSLTVWPGASNVVPGAVNFTIDIRSQHDDVAAVPCDVEIAEQLAAAAAAATPGATPSDVPRLVSGAGHDAMAMADITKMGMLFAEKQSVHRTLPALRRDKHPTLAVGEQRELP